MEYKLKGVHLLSCKILIQVRPEGYFCWYSFLFDSIKQAEDFRDTATELLAEGELWSDIAYAFEGRLA